MNSYPHPLAGRVSSRRLKTVALAVWLATASFAVAAQTAATGKASVAVVATTMAPASSTYRPVRASKVIGMEVRGAGGKNVGKILDLIVNVNTSDVRYAVLEFDPGFFKSERLFGVPLSSLGYVAADKPLSYNEATREQLEKASVGKADWQKALDNSRYVAALDQNYGFKPPTGDVRSIRASKLLGKDVENRAGKGIGEIQELVLDMGASKVHYAVLAFDPSWLSREKLFAFPLSAFTTARDKDDLMLDVDRNTVQSMKNFDASHWNHLNDLNREEFINRPAGTR